MTSSNGGHQARHDELRALLILHELPGVGIRTLNSLTGHFGSATAALFAPPRSFRATLAGLGSRSRVGRTGSGRSVAALRADPDIRCRVDRALDTADRLGITAVMLGEATYPAGLNRLSDPPPVLFLRGRPEIIQKPGIAIVGSRRATQRGRESAERLAAAVAVADVPVVSGLALGIDAAAHRGALAVAGPTVAVLGSGPDLAYPKANLRLYRAIADHGLIVSEFLPGTVAAPHHFPRRNRIIAALAHSVVVIQAAKRSGAKITVDHALDIGNDVYAVPGTEGDRLWAGSDALLEDGARPVTSITQFMVDSSGPPADETREPENLTPTGAAIFAVLPEEPCSVEEIASSAGMDVPDSLAALADLEIDGWAEQWAGMRYRRSLAANAGHPVTS